MSSYLTRGPLYVFPKFFKGFLDNPHSILSLDRSIYALHHISEKSGIDMATSTKSKGRAGCKNDGTSVRDLVDVITNEDVFVTFEGGRGGRMSFITLEEKLFCFLLLIN